jgi:hypothetical protein
MIQERKEVDYCPETFMLPHQRRQLKASFNQHPLWIIKPPALARGIGIKVVSNFSDIPTKKSLIVSRYIRKPFLIEKRKFDLRVYVLVTSFDPLLIYIYEEGVVRFAADPYVLIYI